MLKDSTVKPSNSLGETTGKDAPAFPPAFTDAEFAEVVWGLCMGLLLCLGAVVFSFMVAIWLGI